MATISTDANYSDGSYSNNTNFVVEQGAKFTIDQSTVDLRYVRCLTFGEVLIKNTSTTQPIIVHLGSTGGGASWRFEAAGLCTVEGEWISLGTGNGTAGQTFNVPLAQGANGTGTQSCPNLGGLFINGTDTLRDGTSVPRLALMVDSGGYTNAIDHELGGNVFTHDTTANTVTFKRAVPVGQEVYMPNIIFAIGSTYGGTDFPWDYNTSGQASMDKCIWSGNFNTTCQNAKRIILKNTAIYCPLDRALNLANQIEASQTTSLILSTGNVTPFTLSNSALAGTHKNIWIDSDNTGAQNFFNASNTSNPTVERAVCSVYRRGTNSFVSNQNRGAFNTNSSNASCKDFYNFSYCQTINCTSGASNGVFDNIFFHAGSRTDVTGQISIRGVALNGAIADCVVTNVEQLEPNGVYYYGFGLLTGSGSSNNVFDNIIFRSGLTGNDRWDNIVNDNGNGNRYNNIVVHGQTKDRAVNHGPNSLGLKVYNLYCVDEQTTNATTMTVGARTRVEQVYLNNTNTGGNGNFTPSATASSVDSLSVMGIRNTADGGAVEKTDGMFYLRTSPIAEQTDYYTEITKTGVIQFSNTNRVYIENSGDIIELESFVHNNVDSIVSNATIQGSGTGNFDVTVKMRRPDGTYTSYVALTQSAMQTAYASLPSDSLNRVQFKFRIEKTVTNLTSYLQGVRFDCELTGDDYPFSLYLPSVLTLTGLKTNTEVRIYTAGTTTELGGVENSGTSFQYEYQHDRVTDPVVDIVIHSLGYEYIKLKNVVLGINDSSIPIQQRIDRNFSNP